MKGDMMAPIRDINTHTPRPLVLSTQEQDEHTITVSV